MCRARQPVSLEMKVGDGDDTELLELLAGDGDLPQRPGGRGLHEG